MNQKVCAVFDKPDSCGRCPCSYESESGCNDLCQLAYYLNPDDATTGKYILNNIYVDEIPYWCPLRMITVIGPAREVNE